MCDFCLQWNQIKNKLKKKKGDKRRISKHSEYKHH